MRNEKRARWWMAVRKREKPEKEWPTSEVPPEARCIRCRQRDLRLVNRNGEDLRLRCGHCGTVFKYRSPPPEAAPEPAKNAAE